MNIQRLVEFTDPFDLRDPDPDKNYGIHGAELRMVYIGSKGATQFVLYTQRQLPHVQAQLLDRLEEKGFAIPRKLKDALLAYTGPFEEGKNAFEEIINYQKVVNHLDVGFEAFLFRPLPADLGFHSPKPMYEDHEPMRTTYKPARVESYDFGLFNEDFPFEKNLPELKSFTPPVYGDPIICPYLEDDAPCYYDGSGLNAVRIYNLLLSGGPKAVWKSLEEYYQNLFDEQRADDESKTSSE